MKKGAAKRKGKETDRIGSLGFYSTFQNRSFLPVHPIIIPSPAIHQAASASIAELRVEDFLAILP